MRRIELGAAAGVLAALSGWAAAAAVGPGVDALAYRLSLELGARADAFRASAEITLLVTEAGTDRVRLDLVDLEVDSVKVGGTGARYRRAGGELEVELGRSGAAGDTVRVEVFYRGAPGDGLVFRRNVHGRPTVFADNWPNRARHWFPAIDEPSDKATVEFRVRAPSEWQVVANGRRLAEEVLQEGVRLTVWATDRPIPVYTMVVGAGEMRVRELGALGCDGAAARCVRITQWVFAEDDAFAQRLFQRAPAMVAFFDSLIGPYPYGKLALVQASTRFGGMENASAIFFAERGLATGTASEVTVAHEIAHQWFGDAVTEREWPHLWLSEGFATYFASVFFEFADGDSVASRLRARAEERYLRSAEDVARPVIDPAPADLFDLLNANNYQKGAWVLHMLRRLIGDEAFFAGIRRYYAEFRDGTALTGDVRRIMEDASGRDLSWFFDQWLRRPGYPRVEVRPRWDAESGSLEIQVRQLQSWPPFRFPLEVVVEAGGRSVRRSFWIETRESRHAWPLGRQPDRVRVDPQNALLGTTTLVR